MNVKDLKAEFDYLYSYIALPHGTVPLWCESGLSEKELLEVQKKLGVSFPRQIVDVALEFDDISMDTPYPFEKAYFDSEDARKIIIAEYENIEFDINEIESVASWSDKDEYELKKMMIEDLFDKDNISYITDNLTINHIKNNNFLRIGFTSYGTIYLDLVDPESVSYGVIYHYPELHCSGRVSILHRLASDYSSLVFNMKDALRAKLMEEGSLPSVC